MSRRLLLKNCPSFSQILKYQSRINQTKVTSYPKTSVSIEKGNSQLLFNLP